MMEPSSMPGRKSEPIPEYKRKPPMSKAPVTEIAREGWRMKKRAIFGSRFLRGPFEETRTAWAAEGTASADSTYETASAIAIVRASGLKKAPATPESRAKGKKITIVEMLEPVRGANASANPERAGFS